MGTIRTLVTTTLLLVAGASTARGQFTAEVTPFAGGVVFLSEIVEGFRLDNGVAVGAHLGLPLAGRIGLRATVGFLPSDLPRGTVRFGNRGATVYLASAAVTLDLAGTGADGPYLVGGVGAKRYDFGGATAGSETDPTGSLGVGWRRSLRPGLGLRLEATDWISSFDARVPGEEGRVQHDLLMTVGLGVTLGGGGR